MKNNSTAVKLVIIMVCFFTMGFVDLVGIASNYIKEDMGLSDAQANIFPSLVFFWFLVFSIPTGMLMNKIGRKNTVLLSVILTLISLVLSTLFTGYAITLISFSILGIGSALMQTSINPLLSNIIDGNKLVSMMTFGQFVKAIASFLSPYIAMWGALQLIPTLGFGWRVIFPLYSIISLIAILLLGSVQIKDAKKEATSSFMDAIKLLSNPLILLSFIAIICHVGVDVGTNTTAPKILIERLGIPLSEAGIATSIYFGFRMGGCFVGSFLLQKISPKLFFGISSAMLMIAMIGLTTSSNQVIIYSCIAMIGIGNSNIFPITFSQSMFARPDMKNEVSGLMIMGLFGGAIFPVIMGVASDAVGQSGAVAVMALGVAYLLYYTSLVKK